MMRFQWFRYAVLMAGGCLLTCVSVQAGGRYATPRRSRQSNAPATRVKPAAPAKGKTKADQPKWAEIEKTVKGTLAKTKDYRPGDLITQDEVGKVFSALKSRGWEIKSAKELTERVLPASDEMVRQLRGQPGQKFMRKIAGVPQGYDRLDKLRSLPYGSRRVRELMNDPGGYTLIEYMATTPGGQNLGRQLSSRKRGDFNAPTHRIYTESLLLATLKPIYNAKTPPTAQPSR